MKLLLLVIVACAGLAIVESGSLRVKPSRQCVESELKALDHVDKVLETDDFDFNVIIRSAIIQTDKLFYPVGGAITSDSDPELEWQETLLKAAALERVIG